MTVVIKVGSNVVADQSGELRDDALRGICGQVAELRKSGQDVVIVSSGAIARGIRLLDLTTRPNAMDELQAASAVGQGRLYQHWDELLGEHDVRTAQILLTIGDMSARAHYVNARQTLTKLLEWHVVPVINENDTTATDEITFGDNDFLAAQVAILTRASALILATDIDALYTADPNGNPTAEPIRTVEDFSLLEQFEIGESASATGSGGMASKVVAAGMATAAGIPTIICSGSKPGAIVSAFNGEAEGTRFSEQKGRISSFKLWLRYAKPSRGTLRIDDGAERALRDKSTSLLPVGIVEVTGDFNAGDAVDIVAAKDDDRVIGKGIVNYSTGELTQIKGMKSDQVLEVLPRATEEAINRDYLVLV